MDDPDIALEFPERGDAQALKVENLEKYEEVAVCWSDRFI